ncbi:MAG: MOSC domain-containing protein [Betaproteobacteria bacterium]
MTTTFDSSNPSEIATSTVRLFAGSARPLLPESRPSAIFKEELRDKRWLGKEGLEGDVQADRRVHGGPEKALHQYPTGHFRELALRFPECGADLVAGSIGENLSVEGWDESNVCIGDRFRLGEALIEVSQPRTPCWKIDSRYGVEGMARFIEEHGLTGWYFRVLEAGSVAPGCVFQLVERRHPELTVAALLAMTRAHRPAPEMLEGAAVSALSENWIRKLRERAARLRQWAKEGKL